MNQRCKCCNLLNGNLEHNLSKNKKGKYWKCMICEKINYIEEPKGDSQ